MEGAIIGMLEGLVVGSFVGAIKFGNSTISGMRTDGRSVSSGPGWRVSVGTGDSVGESVGSNVVLFTDGPGDSVGKGVGKNVGMCDGNCDGTVDGETEGSSPKSVGEAI